METLLGVPETEGARGGDLSEPGALGERREQNGSSLPRILRDPRTLGKWPSMRGKTCRPLAASPASTSYAPHLASPAPSANHTPLDSSAGLWL